MGELKIRLFRTQWLPGPKNQRGRLEKSINEELTLLSFKGEKKKELYY